MPPEREKKTFAIFTLGCKVNQWESAFFRTALENGGWKEVSEDDEYEVAIVNTCIVTQKASHQSRQGIRRFIRNNPKAIVVATGCYAQVYPDELKNIEGLDLILGNTLKHALPSMVMVRGAQIPRRCLVEPFEGRGPLVPLEVIRFGERTRAYLKIQEGCESYCTYCIVPKARGPYKSLEPAHVLIMLDRLVREGYKEVVLTGIHLGKYGVDLKPQTNLVDLLQAIGRKKFPLRVRLSSIEPGEVEEGLIEMVASEIWLCRHLHIPLQSGDTQILRAMGRAYTPDQYRDLINKIKERIPLAAIGADVMVGFPGEDEVAFQNTYNLIKDLPISYLHVFPFSTRKNTPAAKLENRVQPEVIKHRTAALRELGRSKRSEFWEACIGKEFEVLVEGKKTGRHELVQGVTDNYISVYFSSPTAAPGDLVVLRLEPSHVQWQEAEPFLHP